MKTNLFDVTEIIENNSDFVMLRVTETEEELAMTGVFSGNETRIRVSRARDETITVWKKDGSNYSWSSRTRVTDDMRRRRSAITMCLLFCYGMPIQLNGLEWPLAIKDKDTIPNPRARILVHADIGTLFDDCGYANRNIKAWFGLEGCRDSVKLYRIGDVLDLLGNGASLVPMGGGSWDRAYIAMETEER